MILPIDDSSSTWLWLTFSGIIGFVIGDLFLFQAYVEVGAGASSSSPHKYPWGHEQFVNTNCFAIAVTKVKKRYMNPGNPHP